MSSSYRVVCRSAAIAGAPPGWATSTLRDGDVALLVDAGGLDAIDAAARALDQLTVPVMRRGESPAAEEAAVIAYAGSLPLVWVTGSFSAEARRWARERGAMTLLVAADGPLSAEERVRIGRFVTLLAPQTD